MWFISFYVTSDGKQFLDLYFKGLSCFCIHQLRNISKLCPIISKSFVEIVLHAFLLSHLGYFDSLFTCLSKTCIGSSIDCTEWRRFLTFPQTFSYHSSGFHQWDSAWLNTYSELLQACAPVGLWCGLIRVYCPSPNLDWKLKMTPKMRPPTQKHKWNCSWYTFRWF